MNESKKNLLGLLVILSISFTFIYIYLQVSNDPLKTNGYFIRFFDLSQIDTPLFIRYTKARLARSDLPRYRIFPIFVNTF